MFKIYFILLIAFYANSLLYAQEQTYFNNIYQHQNNFAIGMTILETDDGYVGYGGTDDPNNIGQMILFYKINKQGEEIIWKPFGENNHSYYYGNVGGAMVKTSDGNFAMACHYGYGNLAYASLIKLNPDLDTIWKRDFNFQTYTIGINCIETEDKGFIITGWVWESGADTDVLLLKTDSLGNYQWHQVYDKTDTQQGQIVIETPDGGYLIGGLMWDPAVYHTLDAMIIKTDSLGNEQWTKYYGNPDVDDDMALVAMADDGNYLVATVYGDQIYSPMVRSGRFNIIKLDNEGNTIFNSIIGNKRIGFQIKNFRKLNSGFVASGFSYETDSSTFQYYSGWMMKLDNNLDSVWYRDYIHEDENWENFLYDASPTSDNGYIAIGQARPDMGGSTNKMWIIKVDSMGCDTPGCITTVINEELLVKNKRELKVWPNPANQKFQVSGFGFQDEGPGKIRVYNMHGNKVKEIKIPDNIETVTICMHSWPKGIYYLRLSHSGQTVGTQKIVKY